MFKATKFMETNGLLERALDTESLRRKVISNNIANVDVPHFKRHEVNFESEMKRAIHDRADSDNRLPAIMTDERHIPFFTPRELSGVRNRIRLDYNTVGRNDGNNVDIEKEMVDAAKNMMRYNAFVQQIGHNFRMLKTAMRTVG